MAIFSYNKLIKFLLREHRVIAPVKKGQDFYFEEIDSVDQVEIPKKTPLNSFKSFIAPYDQNITDSKKIEFARQAIVGVPIFDLKAIALWDQVFDKDPFYQAKRRATIIVAGVIVPDDKKFASQFAENILEYLKFDILHDPTSGGEQVYSGSKTGQEILESLEVENYEHIDYRGPYPAEEGLDKLTRERARKVLKSYHHPMWKKLAAECIECGKCTAACPTCYCFDALDKATDLEEESKRCRRFSSCFYQDFARVAGGHDFLETKADRLYNFYSHKFARNPHQQKLSGCVGCLRCFKVCPVGIDIREILKEIDTSTSLGADKIK